jgi:hypothetical protein
MPFQPKDHSMRKITSLTLVITGLIELITSVVLYILPAGRVAYWSDYQLFGLSKTEWGNIHITVGTLFVVMAGVHIYLNWRPMAAYLKNKAKEFTIFTKSFSIALLLSLYVAIGTLYNLPPMNFIIQLGEYLTESANEKYGEPPYGHAELSSLKMFCARMNLDVVQAMALLQENAVTVKGPEQPIGIIAKNNGLTPQELYSMIKKAEIIQAGEENAFPESPSPGFGQKTIKDICQMYNLPLAKVLAGLQDAGFTAQGDDTVKTVSGSKGDNPMEVFEIIKEISR